MVRHAAAISAYTSGLGFELLRGRAREASMRPRRIARASGERPLCNGLV
jgi:hypothetical protein